MDGDGAERSRGSTTLRAQTYVEEALRWLPEGASAAGEQPDETPNLASTKTDGARIVVADDNADMRAYMRRLLSPRCWRVSGSRSKPNLVAITTCWRNGARASPTSSSLVNGP